MNIPVGLRHEMHILVTPEYAVNFMQVEQARVLSTPWLIAFMELTARQALLPRLEKGVDSVGTLVNIRHLAATPVGMSLTVSAEVIAAEERRVQFRVEAWDDLEKVGEGVHERFIVDVDRFAARVQEKLARRKER